MTVVPVASSALERSESFHVRTPWSSHQRGHLKGQQPDSKLYLSFRCDQWSELVAQLVRASLSALCRAKRPGFEPRSDLTFYQSISSPTVSVPSLIPYIRSPHRSLLAHGHGQNKVIKSRSKGVKLY